MPLAQSDLPSSWAPIDDEQARGFEAELARELSPVHRLYGVAVEAVAVARGSDDALFRHVGEPDTWSVVHLTWIGKQEQGHWPAATFTGTLAEFQEAYKGDSFTRPS